MHLFKTSFVLKWKVTNCTNEMLLTDVQLQWLFSCDSLKVETIVSKTPAQLCWHSHFILRLVKEVVDD